MFLKRLIRGLRTRGRRLRPHYQNFDLYIGRSTAEGYDVSAGCGGLGEPRALLPATRLDFSYEQRELADGQADAAFVKKLGERLYDAVFGAEKGSLSALFNQCLGAARAEGATGVRLRLHIDAPEVAALPWEYLHAESGFLATDFGRSVVRYLDNPRPVEMPQARLPLQVLVVMPTADLATDRERAALTDALAAMEADGTLGTTWLDGVVTLTRLREALIEQPFHVLHFIGHGGPGWIRLNTPDGEAARVDHRDFADTLAHATALKLVVLNSCEGAAFEGMSRALVLRAGIPAIVAMQFPIYDREALCFAGAFYRSLFRSSERGRVEWAVVHARLALRTDFPDGCAVGKPVLFMRDHRGILFDVLTGHWWRDIFGVGWETLRDVRRQLRDNRARRKALAASASSSDAERMAAADHREAAHLAGVERRLRIRVRSVVASVVLALLATFALGLVFDALLPPQLKPEYNTLWIGDQVFPHPFAEDLRLVTLDPRANAPLVAAYGTAFDSLGPHYRETHGRLLDTLSAGGARAVVFGFSASEPAPNPRVDSLFAGAISRARSRGTAVVMSVISGTAEHPDLAPRLAETGVAWGVSCIVNVSGQSPNVTPLVIETVGGVTMYGLAMAAVLASEDRQLVRREAETRQLFLAGTAGPDTVHYNANHLLTVDDDKDCSILRRGDVLSEKIVRFTPRAVLERQTTPYADMLFVPQPPGLFAGTTVFVGEAKGLMRVMWEGRPRYGVELLADAVNSVRYDVRIRWAGFGGDFAVIALMAALGAWIGLRFAPRRRGRRWSLLAAVFLGFMGIALYAYVAHGYLFNALYQSLALLLSYLIFRKNRKRWTDEAS